MSATANYNPVAEVMANLPPLSPCTPASRVQRCQPHNSGPHVTLTAQGNLPTIAPAISTVATAVMAMPQTSPSKHTQRICDSTPQRAHATSDRNHSVHAVSFASVSSPSDESTARSSEDTETTTEFGVHSPMPEMVSLHWSSLDTHKGTQSAVLVGVNRNGLYSATDDLTRHYSVRQLYQLRCAELGIVRGGAEQRTLVEEELLPSLIGVQYANAVTTVDLKGMYIGSKRCLALAAVLPLCPRVQSVSLVGAGLTGASHVIRTVLGACAHLLRLRYLDLSDNVLGDEGGRGVLRLVSAMETLRCVRLDGCGVSEPLRRKIKGRLRVRHQQDTATERRTIMTASVNETWDRRPRQSVSAHSGGCAPVSRCRSRLPERLSIFMDDVDHEDVMRASVIASMFPNKASLWSLEPAVFLSADEGLWDEDARLRQRRVPDFVSAALVELRRRLARNQHCMQRVYDCFVLSDEAEYTVSMGPHGYRTYQHSGDQSPLSTLAPSNAGTAGTTHVSAVYNVWQGNCSWKAFFQGLRLIGVHSASRDLASAIRFASYCGILGSEHVQFGKLLNLLRPHTVLLPQSMSGPGVLAAAQNILSPPSPMAPLPALLLSPFATVSFVRGGTSRVALYVRPSASSQGEGIISDDSRQCLQLDKCAGVPPPLQLLLSSEAGEAPSPRSPSRLSRGMPSGLSMRQLGEARRSVTTRVGEHRSNDYGDGSAAGAEEVQYVMDRLYDTRRALRQRLRARSCGKLSASPKPHGGGAIVVKGEHAVPATSATALSGSVTSQDKRTNMVSLQCDSPTALDEGQVLIYPPRPARSKHGNETGRHRQCSWPRISLAATLRGFDGGSDGAEMESGLLSFGSLETASGSCDRNVASVPSLATPILSSRTTTSSDVGQPLSDEKSTADYETLVSLCLTVVGAEHRQALRCVLATCGIAPPECADTSMPAAPIDLNTAVLRRLESRSVPPSIAPEEERRYWTRLPIAELQDLMRRL